eukprot:gene7609-8216_t
MQVLLFTFLLLLVAWQVAGLEGDVHYSKKHNLFLKLVSGETIQKSSLEENSWIEVQSIHAKWSSVDSSEDESIMVATSRDKGCFVSKDGGSTWNQEMALPIDLNWVDVAVSDDGRVVAVAAEQGSIHVSKDGGKVWVETSAPKALWRAVASDKTGQYLAAIAAYEGIYVSYDYGTTWTQTSTEGKEWQDLSMDKSGQHLAAVVKGGKIYTSSDRGMSWKESLVCEEAAWEAITCDGNGQNLAAVISGGGIYHSNDFGETWEEAIAPREEQWISVTFDFAGKSFVALSSSQHSPIYMSSDQAFSFSVFTKSSHSSDSFGERFDSLFGGDQTVKGIRVNSVDLTSASTMTSNSLPSFETLFTAGSFADILEQTSPPTFTPTAKPTTLVTGYNTQFTNSFTMNAVITVTNADGNVWLNQSDLVVTETIAAILGVSADTIEKGVPIQVLTGRRKLVASYNTTFVISYKLYFDMARYPEYQGNTSALYNVVTKILSDSVAEGVFEDLLRSSAVTADVDQLIQVNTPLVKFENYYFFITSPSPSALPTSIPSSTPSAAPSSAPSMAPSMSDYYYYVQFNAFFGIFNVSGNTIKSGGQQSLLETITDVTDVANANLLYAGITNEVPSGGFTPGRKLAAKNLWDMVVQVQLTVPLSDFPQFKGNGTKLFNYLKSLLNESVVEDIFNDILHKNTLIYQGMELTYADVKSVRFSNFVLLKNLQSPSSAPTSQPSMQPTSNPTLSTPPDTLEFEAFWGLGNLTSVSFPAQAQEVLIAAMSDVMDISESHISFIAITDSLRRKLNIHHELVVATKISIPLNEFPELNGNATKLYIYMTTLLMEAKNDLMMQKLLRQGAVKSGLEDLFWVIVSDLRFVDFRLRRHTVAPTRKPTSSPGLSSAPTLASPTTNPVTAAPSQNNVGNTPAPSNVGQSSSPTIGNGGQSFQPTTTSGSTDVPNSSPTAAPGSTDVPNSSPTAAPGSTDVPNSSPTAAPGSTDVPNSSPTAAPGSTDVPNSSPTAAPGSTDVPNSSPTAAPGSTDVPNSSPTAAPFSGPIPQVIVQYKAILTIANVLSTTTSLEGQNALTDTIFDIENAKRAVIEFLGIRNVVSGRRLETSNTLTVATRLSFNSTDFPELLGNGSAIYALTSKKLSDSVSSGQFDTVLQSNGADTEMKQAQVLSLAFEDKSITNPVVNSNGDQQLPLATADLAAIVSGAIVGFGLLVFLVYVGYTRCRGEKDVMMQKELRRSSSSSSQYSEDMKESIDSDSITLEEIYWDTQEHNEVIVLNIMKDYGIEEDSMLSRIVELPVVNTTSDTRI